MTEARTSSLTHGSILKGMLLFFLPILISSLVQQLYTTVDAIVVGQFVGKTGLAAVDSVHTLFKFPLNFMNGLAAGATILISRYFGEGNRNELHYAVRTALTMAVILGIVASIGGVVLTPVLLDLMQVPSDIVPQTMLYTRIYFAGLWAMVIYNMTSGILRAFGDSKRPLYVLILCSVINICGDLLLVGICGLGVAGAAAATILAQIVSAVVVLKLLAVSERAGGQIRIWHMHFYSDHMKAMVRKGLPLAIQSMLFPIANTIVQASVNTMGTDAIAAWGVAGKLDFLIWLVADSMSPVLTTYVSQNIGAGKKERIRKGVRIGVVMSVVSVALISLLLYFGSGVLSPLFVKAGDVDSVVPLTVHYLKWMAPFYVFYAIGEALSGASCGSGDTVRPMITTLLSICALRVLCIWFILPHYQTMECIIGIYIASWVAVGVAFVVLWRQILKRIERGNNGGPEVGSGASDR